jgi:hypothetical protein
MDGGGEDEMPFGEKEKRRYDRYDIISDNSVDIMMEQPVSSIRGRIINMSSAAPLSNATVLFQTR